MHPAPARAGARHCRVAQSFPLRSASGRDAAMLIAPERA